MPQLGQIYYSNGNYYQMQNPNNAMPAFLIASAASGTIMSTLPQFSKPFTNQLKSEIKNNEAYKKVMEKAIQDPRFVKKGLIIEHAELTPRDIALLNKNGQSASKQIVDYDVKVGTNAYYSSDSNFIKLNKDKISIASFHEMGHAMNNLFSKSGKLLQKMRKPGYAIAGLMEMVAFFSDKKGDGEKRNFVDIIRDNCGKIAFVAMLPVVAEEALASYKGVKLAKANDLAPELVKNLKKFYKKALLTYTAKAAIPALAIFTTAKIMEYFTKPKKIENTNSY